jgi:hypothetical protein
MNGAERQALRAAVDAARRAAIAPTLTSCCASCGEPLTINHARPAKRFCSNRCRTYAWYRETPKGRASLALKKQRWSRRRRGVAPRPGKEQP